MQTAVLENTLKKYLSNERIVHSQRVANLARDIAKHHDIECRKAYTAGLLHDIAREMEKKKLIYIAKKYHLYHDTLAYDMPILLHGHVGAWVVRNKLGIKDEEILEAVKWHTLGSPDMNNLAKIVYIADIIEPGRKLSITDELLSAAMKDLDKAMLHCLDNTFKYLIDKGMIIHPLSVMTRNYFLQRKEW